MIIIYVLCTRSVITAIWQRERGVWEELMFVTHHVLWLFAGSAPKLPVSSLFSASKTHTIPAEPFSEAAPPLGPPVHTPSVWEALAQEDGEAHARDSAWLINLDGALTSRENSLAVGKHLFSSQRNWNVITQTTLENKSKEPKVCEKSFLFCCFDKYFQAQ